MRRALFAEAIVLFCILSVVAAKGSHDDNFSILNEIPSPTDMLAKHFPHAYSVPVNLSGQVADEMNTALKKMDLQDPEYAETLDRKGRIRLHIDSEEYSLETRELISGILNPTEMINIILRSVLKYQSKEQFNLLKKETIISQKAVTWNGRNALRIDLKPKGIRFCYVYEDMGTFVSEEWLSHVYLIIDSQSKCVYKLNISRHGRHLAASQLEKPKSQKINLMYLFEYSVTDEVLLPSVLSLFVNDSLNLKVGAKYRKEGKYIVFDTRTICHKSGSKNACLTMKYGKYKFGKTDRKVYNEKVRPNKYARRLAKSATLSRKAGQALENGDIKKALRILKNLVDDYPETPHAVEARKLIQSLP